MKQTVQNLSVKTQIINNDCICYIYDDLVFEASDSRLENIIKAVFILRI